MLLFALIPLAWLSISVLVLAVCRLAARGDGAAALTPRARLVLGALPTARVGLARAAPCAARS